MYLEGGIPGTDGNAALVLFRGIVVWAKKGMKYMDAVLSLIGGLLKVLWKITKFLCKPAWEGIKSLCKTSWDLYKEKKAQKAACADNSAESESLSTEGASETNDDVGDSESSDSNVQS